MTLSLYITKSLFSLTLLSYNNLVMILLSEKEKGAVSVYLIFCTQYEIDFQAKSANFDVMD